MRLDGEIELDDLDFMDEEPTIRCGEGGCRGCDDAFHRSCDPILRAFPSEQYPRADTIVDLYPGGYMDDGELDYDAELAELGGEG